MAGRVTVFRSQLLPEAHLVRTVLEAHGVEARLLGEHLTGLVGGIPVPDAQIQVWVPGEQAEQARAILGAAIRRDPSGQLSLVDGADETGRMTLVATSDAPPEPETCPACGADWERGWCVCWSCEHELDSD